MSHNEFMKKACELASKAIERNCGPFGAVIVKNDTQEVIGYGHNMVTMHNDPTLHAEIVAIKHACHFLNSFKLDDCTLYTSCEPCPMCLGAAYWARIPTIYYGNTKADAKNIGFDDSFIYEELNKPVQERSIQMIHMNELKLDAKKAFEEWTEQKDKIPY